MSTIAAPLLAAGAITIFGVVVQAPDMLRSAGLVLLLLTIAAASLILCVQLGFHARHYFAMPDDVRNYVFDLDKQEQDELIERSLSYHYEKYYRFAGHARRAFGVGLIFLWSALAVAAWPPLTATAPGFRCAAAAVCGAIAIGEVLWIVVIRR